MQQPSLSFNQLKTARCCAQLERPQQKYVIAAMLRAASNPVVAAAAAATGQLHQVLQEAQQWHQSSNGLAVGLLCMQPQFSGAIAHAASSTMLPAVLQAFAAAKVLDACFDTLTLSAAQASQLGGLGSSLLEELRSASAGFCQSRSAIDLTAGRFDDLFETLGQVMQPASQVAALLQQCWEQPEQRAADELALAQAAATRSCAYLHCTNVACEGGPAAGEGAGSMRCR